MKPKLTDQGVVVQLLSDASELVDNSDSTEGTITWEQVGPAAAANAYAVRAVYRTGSSMGQGGVVLYGDNEGPQPAEPWGPLRGLLDACKAREQCRDCKGTGRLRRGIGKGTYTEECYCSSVLADAQRRAEKAYKEQGEYLRDMQAKGIDTAA